MKRGDRVKLDARLAAYHGCEYGTVYAVWPGLEDTIELRLDTRDYRVNHDTGYVYTCTDPDRLTVVVPAPRLVA